MAERRAEAEIVSLLDALVEQRVREMKVECDARVEEARAQVRRIKGRERLMRRVATLRRGERVIEIDPGDVSE